MFIITNPEGTVNDTLYDETFLYTFQNPGYYNVTYYAKTAENVGCDDWLVNEPIIFMFQLILLQILHFSHLNQPMEDRLISQ